jgi:hypothetical protein
LIDSARFEQPFLPTLGAGLFPLDVVDAQQLSRQEILEGGLPPFDRADRNQIPVTVPRPTRRNAFLELAQALRANGAATVDVTVNDLPLRGSNYPNLFPLIFPSAGRNDPKLRG